jgi:hypothetical protein
MMICPRGPKSLSDADRVARISQARRAVWSWFRSADRHSARYGLLYYSLLLLVATTIGPAILGRPAPGRARAQSEGSRAFFPLALLRLTADRIPTAVHIQPPTPLPTLSAATATQTTEAATVEPTPSPTGTVMPERCDGLWEWDELWISKPRFIHVSVDGDDRSGDGSLEKPFASIQRAARDARPGDHIRLGPGRYAGGTYVEGLQGSERSWIWLGGASATDRPVISGGGTGLHLVKPRYLGLQDLEIEGASDNGINVDDGGEMADPEAAGHLSFVNLSIHDIGTSGNQDCLKLSGLYDVLVADSQFERCGGGGSGIDMVGVHRALVARNRFEEMGSNAVQIKGGSSDIEVRWNRMREAGARAVNMGGSTGFEYFRPPLDPVAENAEARDVRVLANLIQGGETPWAFVGCVDCLAAHNTVIEPRNWLMRILQETTSQGGYHFAPARDGRVENNLFVFRRGQLRADVNVGGGTEADSFRFAHNLFYAPDDPARSAPQLPGMQMGNLSGLDPLLRDDFSIPAESPAAGAGLAAADDPRTGIIGDLNGRCWQDPPAIGAFEVGP